MTNRYLVVYAKTADSFSGFAPDVPGCISAGDTLEEMRAMLTEGLTFHLEGLADDGDPLPVPQATQVNFTDEDFAGVEYFVVEHLAIPVPAVIQHLPRFEPTAA